MGKNEGMERKRRYGGGGKEKGGVVLHLNESGVIPRQGMSVSVVEGMCQ